MVKDISMSDLDVSACISRPLQVVQALYERMAASVDCAAVHQEVEKHFRSVLSDEAVLQQVPYLTADGVDLAGCQGLVRFRAMVQDMLNPEYFVGAYQRPDGTWGVTHYSDATPADLQDATDQKLWERRPLYCTPVPAESDWATNKWQGTPPVPPTPPASERAKRARELEHAVAFCGAGADAGACDVGASSRDQGAQGSVPCKVARTDAVGAGGSGDARLPGEQQQDERPQALPGDCLVYVYGDAERFKLHDIVEVVGCVGLLPQLAAPAHLGGAGAAMMELDDAWQAEVAGAHPPTSQVPRLHALTMRTQRPRALPPPGPRKPLALDGGDPAARAALVRGLRDRALDLVALALGGDRLAAEYVLLAAMGRVFHRAEGVPTGLVSVNLVGCPADGNASGSAAARALHAALSALLPAVCMLPMSVGALNAGGRWTPRKDHDSGRLLRGKLQLAAGTLVLLDECGMDAGELSEAGVANLRAAATLLRQQQVSVDFQFYQTTFGLDVPCVVLSAGRSLLKDCIHVTVRLQPTAGALPPAEVVAAAAEALGPEIDALRELLGRAMLTQTQLPQALVPELSREYAALHARDPAFGTAEFNTSVTMAKLLAMSWGHETFGMEDWRRLRALEGERTTRDARS